MAATKPEIQAACDKFFVYCFAMVFATRSVKIKKATKLKKAAHTTAEKALILL
jgi:hypothetical protein